MWRKASNGVTPNRRAVLFELRPALGGHAGIPQETRLLFRGLSLVDELRVEGLLQSNEHLLSRGLPPPRHGELASIPMHRQLDRMGRVVISIEQGTGPWHLFATIHTVVMVVFQIFGRRVPLTTFDSEHFRDFLWRKFFARTLPPSDFDVVTRASFRIVRIPWFAMHICAMVTRRLGYALFPRLDTRDFDMMITETPYPARVSAGTALIVRYHDAIPLLMPHTISDRSYHQSWHYRSLRRNVQDGAWFVCVSDATRRDLLSIFPEVENRSLTIHNMVSHHYFDEPSDADRVPEIIKTRLNMGQKPPLDPSFRRHLFEKPRGPLVGGFVLIVSTIEPRKNHLTLLAAWERLRVEKFPGLKLIAVGALGWRHKRIIRKFRPWMEQGEVYLLEDLPASELRLLYKHARATVCPSFGEGFDFSGVEAMKSGGAVIASDIEVHREIYSDAASFFNPYSVDSLVKALVELIDDKEAQRREALVRAGARVAERYSYESILPRWRDFLANGPQSTPRAFESDAAGLRAAESGASSDLNPSQGDQHGRAVALSHAETAP